MLVEFVGNGNVATQMAQGLKAAGCDIGKMYSRKDLGGGRVGEPDVLIIAVSDREIVNVVARLPQMDNTLVLHTSGSVSVEVLDCGKFRNFGVIYPLQTILKDVATDWSQVPLFIEGDDPLIEDMAKRLSPNRVGILSSDDRCRLHAAAAIACNLTMYLWHQSRQTMADAGLDFRLLEPLMSLTLQRALQGPPGDALTGPARRGDTAVLLRHLEVIPLEAKEPYRLISQRIFERYNK